MPFAEEFTDIYKLGIKPACEAAGAYCERIDEQIFYESILDRIYNQIAKADIIVADMSGRNPNVFYEVGYAHALNKKVILLTNSADDIPFDLKHYPHIVYSGKITTLKSELDRKISWYMNYSEPTKLSIISSLEYYVNGKKIVEGTDVDTFDFYGLMKPDVIDNISISDDRLVVLSLGIHNPTNRVIDTSRAVFALITNSNEKIKMRNYDVDVLPDKSTMVTLGSFGEILPDFWKTLEVEFSILISESQRKIQFILKVFSEEATKAIPFTVCVHKWVPSESVSVAGGLGNSP